MFNFIKDNPLIFLIIFLAIVAPSLLTGMLQVVFYIIAGILLVGLILGIIFKVKINRLRKEMEEQMGDPFRRDDNFRRRKEDDVEIYQDPTKKKKISDEVGEYVDFEEMDEQK